LKKKLEIFFILTYKLDICLSNNNNNNQNTKKMTHLLEFEKIKPTSSYETVSYKSVYKINDKIFIIYVDKCIFKPNKYTFNILHNGRTYRAFATYTSAKKAMIDSEIRVKNIINS